MSVAVNGDDHSVDSNPDETQATEDTEQDLMEDVQDEVQKVKSHETAIEEAFEDLGMDEGEDQDKPNFDESTGDDFEDRNEEFLCQICNENLKTPKVLSCLHVYCQECLEKQVEPSSPNEDEPVVKQNSIITCLICKQETVVGPKGVAELQPDNVMVNLQDMEAINKMRIICTSCKANEKAVARCSDCANFLCPNCVTAHQYMRCFEKHKVVSFEDMGSGFSLHKPLFCANHSTESLKYFCLACQIPVCTECMVTIHKHPEHQCERIGELDDKLKNEVGALVKEARSKEMYCQHATSNLENSLTELQMQRDNARGLIEETFQTYRTILEEQKKHMLYELEDIHNQQEDEIMHVFDNVGKTIEKIQDSCKFTERVMQQGNCTEVLLVKRLIFTQLMSLINNTPRAEVKVKIKFSTNANKFREAIKTTFGCFKTEHIVPTSGFHSSFIEGINLSGNLLGAGDTGSLFSVDLAQELSATLAPLSLTSVAGSACLSGVSPQTINSIASSIQSLTGGGPSHVTPPPTTPGAPGQPGPVERSSSRNSYSPSMSDSGILGDAACTSSGCQTGVTFAALQRLGSVNANSQGQILLNGQLIPGLHVNNVSGFPPIAQRSSTPDSGIVSLLGGMSSSLQRPTTPLGDISNVLNQPAAVVPTVSISSSFGAGLPLRSPTAGLGLPVTHQFAIKTSAKGNPNQMDVRRRFGQLGPGKGQFNSPHGFCLGIDEDIVVADTNNHRVQVFDKTGEFKYQFGIPGREEGQLWYPRKVAVMRMSGKYIVCDRGNERSRMQIFTKSGHFIKKISIRYIDIVAGVAVSPAGHIIAVDSVSPSIFILTEAGTIMNWIDCSDYMREPSDIAVSDKEFFVCDFKGHCVVVFNETGQFVRRIGCENITNFPNGIDISDAGDILVGDSHGNRFHVAVFQCDGSLIGEFECPYVKVSRCCGLKITSEGYVVTLAKNNHHVLVLNTLYIA